MSLEIPLVVCDIQRGGPSTGLPTKTEQSDLLQAMFGRNGEAPVPIVAAQSPADCFAAALEAVRIALRYRTPVFLLSDGYLANGSEPWRVPNVADLPDLSVPFATEPNGANGTFLPYLRDPDTLARPWAIPGTPGLEHRLGGIEKADRTGNISYDPDNHDFMVRTRQAKVDGIARTIPPLTVDDPDGDARVLVIGWGSTYGTIGAACATGAPSRIRHRSGAFAAPEPVPVEPRHRACQLRQGRIAGDEPWPAGDAHSFEIPGGRHQRHAGPWHAVPGGRPRRDAARSADS